MMNLLRITADEATLAVIAEVCFRAGLATRLGAADFAEAADFGWQRDPAVNKRTGKPLSPNRYISTGPTPKAGTVRYFKTPPKGLEGGSPQPAEQATEPPAEAQPVEQVPIPAHVRDTAEMLRSMSKQDLTDEKMAELQTMLAGTGGRTGWSVADLKALKQQLGVSAYGNKSEMAQRIIAGAKKNAADRGAELLPVDEPPPAGPAISEPPPVGAASPEAPPAAEAPPVGEPAPAGPTAGPPPATPSVEAMPAETPTSPAASAPLHERIAHLVNNGGSEADLRSAMKELGDLNTADRLELARAVASATGRSFTGTNKMAVTAKLGAWMRDAVDRSSGIDRNNNARAVRSLEEDYGPQGETAEGTSPPKSPADLVREIASDADSSKDAVHGFYQHLDGLAGSLDERGKAALLQELGGQYTGNFHEDVRRAFPDHDIPSRKQFERDEKKYRDRLHEMGRGIDELSRVGRAPKTEKASGPPVPTPRASTPPAPPAEADSPAPERDRQWAASQQRERGQSPLPAGAAPEKDEAPLQAALQHFRRTRGRPYVMKLAEAARKALAAGQSSAQFIASQGKALRPEDARMARVLYRSMRQQGASFELLEALGRIADGEATFDALAPFLGDDHAIPAD